MVPCGHIFACDSEEGWKGGEGVGLLSFFLFNSFVWPFCFMGSLGNWAC